MNTTRAYLTEAKYESIRMLRAPGFSLPFLGLPVLLYLLFAVLIAGAATSSDPAVARFLFSGFSVFGVVGPAMFGFGIIVATEREQGLLKLKRALPMPPAAYLIAKALMALLFAAIVMATMLAAGLSLGHVTLTAGQILSVAAVGILGALPFCALGLWIGVWATARSAPAFVNLIYLPMLHLSGLFYPLPKFLWAMAPVWPTYHLNQLAYAAIGADHQGSPLLHAAVLAGVTLLFGGLALRRLEPEEPDLMPPDLMAETVDAAKAQTSVAVGTLRACITALVVAHHAVLAYHPYAPPLAASLTAEPRWWQAFPIVDSQRWGGFGLLTLFNDLFFMSLMFFLSGLFVWHSLQRKGSGGFLRQRALRLGLPFAAAAAVVAPLSYFPTYLATGAAPSLSGFWQQWSSLGQWPAGPAWFLWVLLAFDALAAALFLLLPKWGDTLGRFAANAARRPAAFFWLLAAVSAVAYVPMAVAFTSAAWSSFGPFVFQTSRLFHYAVYFLAGAAVGAYGLEKGLLAPAGKLARRWPAWVFVSLGAFAVALVILTAALSSAGKQPRLWETIGGFTFVLSCAASSFAFLALFVRFAKARSRIFDSLRENAYGIFLIHYAFVSWLQYTLLKAPLSGLAKGSCVFLGALALSWAVTAALRRIPGVARVI